MSQLVISEPDSEAAVAHLRELPRSATASIPVEWPRKRFQEKRRATLVANPKAKCAARCAWRVGHRAAVRRRFDRHVI